MSEREDGILLQQHGDWETRAHWDVDLGGERRLRFRSWWRVRGDRWTWNDCSSLPAPAVDRLKALLAQPSSAPAGDAEALASGNDTPWPLRSVLNVLANAADHLLRDHNCDEHGWEMTSAARDAARALLAAAPSPKGAPASSDLIPLTAEGRKTLAALAHRAGYQACDGGAGADETCAFPDCILAGCTPERAEGAPEGSGDVRVLAEQQARAARLFAQGRDQERIAVVAGALAREASTWEVAATDTVWRHLAIAALATDADYRASANAAEQEGDVRVLVEALERMECDCAGTFDEADANQHGSRCPRGIAMRALTAYRASLASPAASTGEKP